MANFRKILKLPGQEFRFRLFARIREQFEQGKTYLLNQSLAETHEQTI
jgi:hypothetical protein